MASTIGVRWRLLAAFMGISALAALAAAAAIYFSYLVGGLMERIAEEQVPLALSSLELSRESERIMAAAPALLSVSDRDEHQALQQRIDTEAQELRELLAELERSGRNGDNNDAFNALAPAVAGIGKNLAALNDVISGRLEIAARERSLMDGLFEIHAETQKLLAPWVLTTDAEIRDLRDQSRDPARGPDQRAASALRLDARNETFRRLRSAELLASSINDTLLKATVEEDRARLDVHAFRLRRQLQDLQALAAELDPRLRALLMQRVAEFSAIAQGPDGIPRTQERELELLQRAEILLAENSAIARQLTTAVDRLVTGAKRGISEARGAVLSAQQFNSRLLISIVAVAILSSVLIVWLYVGRNLVGRLISLSDSMAAISRGSLDEPLAVGGEDEIARMAEALEVFRQTALVVRETNLQEIREARRRLTDAIESISEGFALFDADDRLVVANSRYGEQYPGLVDLVKPGVSFEQIIRAVVERGIVEFGDAGQAAFVRQRLEHHRNPAQALLQKQADGRWIQVSERVTGDGGRVAVYTDVTDLKEQELAVVQAKNQAEQALADLKQAQTSLVQAQKLALLGQLAAGIAHEIKNPLNFVNNFAELTEDLLQELRALLTARLGELDASTRAEVEDLFATLGGNLRKINEHGERADAIVRGMLAHSRGGAGDRRAVDINALLEESLNLAYHGARATDHEFNISLERDFDPDAGLVEVIPQDLTRVFLNLFGNSFDATRQRQVLPGQADYRPTLRVTTAGTDESVEIRVRDNGIGIGADILDKVFTPFFTTKPAREGTGLGLSISYDIIVGEHQGEIQVDSREGEYTEFRIKVPRRLQRDRLAAAPGHSEVIS